MLVKLRWLRKERRIAQDTAEALAAWQSPEGMRVFKCRANGTKAVQKVFRLARDRENVLVWNAGVMSKMRGGVELHEDTLVRQTLLLPLHIYIISLHLTHHGLICFSTFHFTHHTLLLCSVNYFSYFSCS
jgi:hypothetical protein